MCGIAGLAGGDAVRHEMTVARMGEAQHYRGPDGTVHAAVEDAYLLLHLTE